MEVTPAKGWALKREISLGTLIALTVQTAGFVWAAAMLWAQVSEQDRRITAIEALRAGERLAVMESTMADVKQQLVRIELKIDRLVDAEREKQPK